MTKLPDNVRAAMERIQAIDDGVTGCTIAHNADWQTIRDYLVRQEANAARYVWLRDHKCNALHLTRDGDHACNYMTAKQWIEEASGSEDQFADVPPDELQKMKDTNTIWQLQIYPNTPVGFNWWFGASLDVAIDAAMLAAAAREG